MIYLYDGSYDGFLTCVFESFERRDFDSKIFIKGDYVTSIFDETKDVVVDNQKSLRVKVGLDKALGKTDAHNCYRVFLAEDAETINVLFKLIQRIFKEGPQLLNNFGDESVLHYHQMLKKVNRERHRMQAFIRFQKTTDGMFFALIEPDFNVLPLLIRFFKNRYTDQNWLIYDVKRKYGMLYNNGGVEEVMLSEEQSDELSTEKAIDLEDDESFYQDMWKQYFKSTNIVQRKNLKLHLRHVPKRYWKYLIEKQ